ncbi:hypothetical protein ABPG73_021392 [Tetrahymena malaccensis]
MAEKNKNQIYEQLLFNESQPIDHSNQDEKNERDIKQNQTYKTRYQRANIISIIFFWWAFHLVRLGNRLHLEQGNLDQISDNQKSSFNYNRFMKNFVNYERSSNQALIRSLVTTFRRRLAFSFLICFFQSGALMSTPYIIKALIEYSSNENLDYIMGIILICAVILQRIIICILSNHSNFQFNLLGFDLTNTVSVAILQKSFRYSLSSTDDYKVGNLVNMIQVDAQRLLLLCNQLSITCFVPFQIVFSILLMPDTIGISQLFGVAVMLIMWIANYFVARLSFKYSKFYKQEKDDRMKITTEIFNAIKFIKANAWEQYFYDKLDFKRQKELSFVAKKFKIGSVLVFFEWITPVLIINATFGSYVLLGNKMTAVNAFTVISIFSILYEPIRTLPLVINSLTETYVSIKRIEKFLSSQEINNKFLEHNLENTSDAMYALKITNGNFYWRTPQANKQNQDEQGNQQNESSNQQNKQTEGQNSSFCPVQETDQDEKVIQSDSKKQQPNQQKEINLDSVVDKDSYLSQKYSSTIIFNDKIQDSQQNQQQNPQNSQLENLHRESSLEKQKEENKKYILKNINITIPKGKLIAIIGDVGCGKSSLLQSIIGEMKYDDQNMPKVEINGTISLVSQKPWILNATIKDNILFGLPFEEDKYEQCVKDACLKPDFQDLINGDQTQIGENGVNLSGGQKARISLARSLYSNSSILLLDEILSAVDIEVGRFIVQECLLKYKKNTTIILTTNHFHFLKYMDYIYFMKDGQIILEGDYQYIQEKADFKQYKQGTVAEFKNIYEKIMKHQFENEQHSEKKEDFIFSEINISPKSQIDREQLEKNKEIQQDQYQSTNESEEGQQIEVQNPKKSIALKQEQDGSMIQDEDFQAVVIDEIHKDDLMLQEDRKKGSIQK